jgi:hypothetical protein
MERTRLRKTAALACSLALAGAYVGYRLVRASDAAPPPSAPSAESAPAPPIRPSDLMPSSKSFVGVDAGVLERRPEAEPPARPRADVPFWGSKSARVFEPAEPETPPPVPGK